jgi:hypothetical protein
LAKAQAFRSGLGSCPAPEPLELWAAPYALGAQAWVISALEKAGGTCLKQA